MIAGGRADLTLIGRKFVHYYLKNVDPSLWDKLEIVDKTYKEYNLYVAISKQKKDGEKIISDFNQGLSEIIADGSYDKILNEYGFN